MDNVCKMSSKKKKKKKKKDLHRMSDYFLEKNKINIINFTSADFAQRMVKAKLVLHYIFSKVIGFKAGLFIPEPFVQIFVYKLVLF